MTIVSLCVTAFLRCAELVTCPSCYSAVDTETAGRGSSIPESLGAGEVVTEKWMEEKKNHILFIFFVRSLTGNVSAETGKSDNTKLSSQFS